MSEKWTVWETASGHVSLRKEDGGKSWEMTFDPDEARRLSSALDQSAMEVLRGQGKLPHDSKAKAE